jgi:class 3 adenylate cyclase
MRLFDNYLRGLDGVLSKKAGASTRFLNEQKTFSESIQKSIQGGPVSSFKGENLPEKIEGPKVVFTYDKSNLTKYFGENPDSFDTITIGAHPDFKDLGFSNTLYHHCVSVFVDIKGSTRLIEKYSLEEVRMMKDSLLTLAIHVANQFGGHVHRLQGDGIFLQFVRRNKNPNDAIVNALNATAILTQFVSIDLSNMLSQYEIKPLKIRTGIDFGADDKVLWAHYGIPNCKELTTTSLHTDMAAKLQAKAFDNSILIGNNIKEALDLKQEFWMYYETQESKERVYNISTRFSYPFFVFDWQTYLLSLPFMGKSSNGKDLEIKERPFSIECYISNDDGTDSQRYFPNSKSIPKEKKITYKLMRGNSAFVKLPFEKIEWYAFNSGAQAAKKEQLRHDFGKAYHGKNYCETHAAYLGHHHVECKIIRDHSPNENITFPIFVQ